MKVILLPGNEGHEDISNYCWFPYLKQELEPLGLKVVIKNMPDPKLARAKYWLPFIINELKADENSILIGHSSGAVAIMRLLEKMKLYGVILVGAHYTDLGYEEDKLSGYFDKPWNWGKIKKNANWTVQFASTNDPFIPIEHSRHIYKKLDTEYYEMEAEHFGYPNPKLEFSEVIEIVKRKLSKSSQ